MKKYLKETNVFVNEIDIHVQFMKFRNEPIHTHEFFEFVYVLDGELHNKVDGIEYVLKPGSLLFVNFEQTHEIFADEDVSYVNVLVSSNFIKSNTENFNSIFDLFSFVALHGMKIEKDNFLPVIKFENEEKTNFDNLICSMLFEYNGKRKDYEKVLYHQFYVMILNIIRNFEFIDKDNVVLEVNQKMSKIMDYIDENYNKNISLNSVAHKFFYNSSYFSRMFKTILGVTFKEYLQQVRIRKAIKMMLETNASFERISEEIGYADKKQFYNVFKKKTGMTPGEYKKKVKKNQ